MKSAHPFFCVPTFDFNKESRLAKSFHFSVSSSVRRNFSASSRPARDIQRRLLFLHASYRCEDDCQKQEHCSDGHSPKDYEQRIRLFHHILKHSPEFFGNAAGFVVLNRILFRLLKGRRWHNLLVFFEAGGVECRLVCLLTSDLKASRTQSSLRELRPGFRETGTPLPKDTAESAFAPTA